MFPICLRTAARVWIRRGLQTSEKQPAANKLRVWTVPNALSLSRLLSAPALGGLVMTGHYKAAFCVACAAGVTDVVRKIAKMELDGYIAKRYNQRSIVGSFLDPIADKTLLTISAVTLAAQAHLPVPLVGLMLLRDCCLVTGAAILRYKSLPKPVNLGDFFSVARVPSMEIRPLAISKANTVLQLTLVMRGLASAAFAFGDTGVMDWLGYTVMVTTLWSGIAYGFAGARLHRAKQDADSSAE